MLELPRQTKCGTSLRKPLRNKKHRFIILGKIETSQKHSMKNKPLMSRKKGTRQQQLQKKSYCMVQISKPRS